MMPPDWLFVAAFVIILTGVVMVYYPIIKGIIDNRKRILKWLIGD